MKGRDTGVGKKVMVGLSGGVDSAVAAHLLKDQGYEVAGVTMCLSVEEKDSRRVRCCGTREIEDAGRVCRALGIGHQVVDFASELRRFVIEPFICEYGAGRTPNPCVECNRRIKFGILLDLARSMGFDCLATGHYAGIGMTDREPSLAMPRDAAKDQTYFLSAIPRASLEHVLFPLSGLTKEQVREIARAEELPVFSKPESQDICFIPDNGTEAFLRERISSPQGDIVDLGGKVLGQHRGLAFYTIGQRARLSTSSGRVLYVVNKDIPANRIVVGGRESLLSRRLIADRVNLLADHFPERARAKIRYAHTPAACRVEIMKDSLTVTFDEPQEAVTPGQTVAVYDDRTVLGSAVIREAMP